ncbi:A24 family peptidase [Salinivibrio socompensis]|uniref:A24 family peptidase n=1 Tax=Salinivibrio socompensis TaxID=1510206 RepID=UPI000687311A|nr:prepilin peptidase [Salinivibrio socompensis]
MPQQVITLLSLICLCLVMCIVSDIKRRTIEHWVIAVITVLAGFTVYWAQLPVENALTQAGLVLVAGFILFWLSVCGAGDVKLLVAVSLAVGEQWWPWMLLLMVVLGGIVALGLLLASWLGKPQWRAHGVPYALAIAPSGMLAIGLTLASAA